MGTGSEPRRFRRFAELMHGFADVLDREGFPASAGRLRGEAVFAEEDALISESEEVESGHDEQTEAWDREDLVQAIREELARGSYMTPGELLPYEDKARAIAAVILERFKEDSHGSG